MKITPKILSIPPYLSTAWIYVRSLYAKDSNLFVSLIDGATIAIPGLSIQDLELVFNAHTAFLESLQIRHAQEQKIPFHLMQAAQGQEGESNMLRFNFDNMESLGSALQHNPAQANMPDLPPEIVQKIAAIARIIAPGELQNMPKPEAHCNCPHCQIARAIHSKDVVNQTDILVHADEAEVITENDLSFQQWAIAQTGDKLFCVTNKLDPIEKYNVFLGDPIGCTCGHSGCEHILAVLKS